MGVFLGLACAALALSPASPRPKRLVIVSWDGGADWVVDRLLSEGKLPTLARFRREGAYADQMIQAFPSKTAVGHFTAYSGTWPRKSGVTGNSVPILPRAEHTILETRNGFDANSHLTEPLWVTVAKAGKRAVALSAAGSFPPGPDQERLRKAGVPLDRFVEFSGFEAGIAGGFMVPNPPATAPVTPERTAKVEFSIGELDCDWFAEDDPEDPTVGFDTVHLRTIHRGDEDGFITQLKPGKREGAKEWKELLVEQNGRIGRTHIRLFSLDPKTGRAEMYVRAAAGMQGTQSREENVEYLEAYGGFHDNGFGPYELGAFGKQLYAGGDGTAEKRLLEIIDFDHRLLARSFAYGWDRYKGDVYWHYTPASDSAGHCWMGLLDPQSRAYDKKIADKIWPYYAQVFQIQDRWLGEMMRKAGRDTAFAVLSDHGMAGVDRYFHPNFVLEKAGLLFRTADGKIDLTRSKACVPPWGDNQIVVNGTDWKGGIVPPEERETVLKQAAEALRAARDPETGKTIVTEFFQGADGEMGIGGPAGADLYFDLLPSFTSRSGLSSQMITHLARPRGEGVHGFYPMRRDMHAIFLLHGPGVAPGVNLGQMNAVDIAPTLCRLLGIEPAQGYDGRVIEEALKG